LSTFTDGNYCKRREINTGCYEGGFPYRSCEYVKNQLRYLAVDVADNMPKPVSNMTSVPDCKTHHHDTMDYRRTGREHETGNTTIINNCCARREKCCTNMTTHVDICNNCRIRMIDGHNICVTCRDQMICITCHLGNDMNVVGKRPNHENVVKKCKDYLRSRGYKIEKCLSKGIIDDSVECTELDMYEKDDSTKIADQAMCSYVSGNILNMEPQKNNYSSSSCDE